jgi:L-iditol 2-dehydrogenase
MKAAKYYGNKDIRIIDIPRPKITNGEILVQVKASGICGTDAMEWYRLKKGPRILGHEIAGDIIESKSKRFKVGQRVFVSHHVPCDKCKYCDNNNQTACQTLHSGNYDPGGYAEFVRVPEINVEKGTYILPDEMTYEGATMIEPLACCIRAQSLLDIDKNTTLLIQGCGISGLMNIALAKSKGAKVVATDINDFRLQKAIEYGADKVCRPDELPDFRADVVLICTGAGAASKTAFEFVDKKGTILYFAIPKELDVPIVDIWRNELTITSSYGATPKDLERSMELYEKTKVKDLITHTLPLSRIQEGFDLVTAADNSLKVVLLP